jgi:ABC-2 type transport system permease protein
MTTATHQARNRHGSAPASPVTAARVLTLRSLRLGFRQIDGLIVSVILPVMLMTLFVYVFGGAIDTGTEYLNYVVPGIILLTAGFGAAQTAMSVSSDLTTGMVDRFRSMPMPIPALLGGHALASLLRNLATTVIVIGVALIMGFRPTTDLPSWLLAAGVISLYILAIAWISVGAGVLARTTDAASGFTFFMLFLPYVSSAFVPPETLPAALRGFAEHQPITPIIETIRALLSGASAGDHGWAAVAWCVGIIAVAVPASAGAFRRRTRT